METPPPSALTLPPCLGDYEPRHPTCDGDPNGETYHDRRACARRDECVAFRLYCAKSSHDPTRLRKTITAPRLLVLCSRVIETYAIEDGVPRAADGQRLLTQMEETTHAVLAPQRTTLPSPKVRKPRWKKRQRRTLSDEMLAMHDHFVDVLRQHFPERKVVFGHRVVAKPGVFYYVDHRAEHYISWYCKAVSGHDRPLAMLVFRPRSRTITVRLPVSIEVLSKHVAKATMRRLDFVPYKKTGSRFVTEALHQKNAGLAMIAEILRLLHDRGLLLLADQR